MRNKATKKNMDLDLRRYGNNLYSKAEQSGGGGSGEVDYEAIYQFYRKALLESVPEEDLQNIVVPEHLEDVEKGSGTNHANGTWGIWKALSVGNGKPLFVLLNEQFETINTIYLGIYGTNVG